MSFKETKYKELLNQDNELKRIASFVKHDNDHIFNHLLDNIDDVFWINNKNQIIYINSACKRVWGISVEEVYANPEVIIDIIHPNDKLMVLDKFMKSKNTFFSFDYRIIRPDKKQAWIRANVLSVYNENEKLEKYIATARDITKEKKVARKLLESEYRFRKLFENIPTGVAIYKSINNGEDFKFIDLNKTAKSINKVRREEFVNKTLLEVFPNMRSSVLFKGLQTVEKTSNYLYLEPFYYKDNRREGWRESFIYKLPSGEIVAIFNDITERKTAELLLKNKNFEIERAKLRAEESNRLKTEFLNNMSHEIRTPMNGIIGFSKMLNNPHISDEERNSYSKIVESSGYQLLRVIDDILAISALEAKQEKLKETDFSLNELLRELVSIFKLKAQKKGLTIDLKIGLTEEKSRIRSDKTKLNIVLSNLIENALRYTDKGFVEVGYYLDLGNLVLYVKDSGIGISPAYHKNVFERFSQEDRELSRRYGGLGLGLAISKANTELLGGEITLESEKGKGATFYVKLPYTYANINKTSSSVKPKQTTIPQKELTILVAEDEEINFLYIQELFKVEAKFKYSLIRARDGQETLDICTNNNKIDIVLLDLRMPILNGFVVARKIKKLYPKLPIIALTAYSFSSDRTQALRSGCDDFISKPIHKEVLFATIFKHLTNK